MTEGLIPPQVFEQLKPELVSPLVVVPRQLGLRGYLGAL